MDYHGLSWTIMDYHVSFFANIDSISTTLSSISTTLIFNLMTVYPQLFQYIHNLAQYIHNFNSVYPQPRSLLLSRCRDWKFHAKRLCCFERWDLPEAWNCITGCDNRTWLLFWSSATRELMIYRRWQWNLLFHHQIHLINSLTECSIFAP